MPPATLRRLIVAVGTSARQLELVISATAWIDVAAADAGSFVPLQ